MNKNLTIVPMLLLALFMASCNDQSSLPPDIQARLDSLEQKLKHSYTPGTGELMLSIQIHHAKLWFAGKNGNWELAAYDQSLIRSAFQKIRTYHSDNPAATATSMIDPPMDSVSSAIAHKDVGAFRHSFEYLTATCNNCHVVTKHAFNLITIPAVEPMGNQSFSVSLNLNKRP